MNDSLMNVNANQSRAFAAPSGSSQPAAAPPDQANLKEFHPHEAHKGASMLEEKLGVKTEPDVFQQVIYHLNNW